MSTPKKVYTTKPTKGKDGITRPVTRVHLEKQCPLCHQPMVVETQIKKGVRSKDINRWRCTDSTCNHSEIDESEEDRIVRFGSRDHKIGILKESKREW